LFNPCWKRSAAPPGDHDANETYDPCRSVCVSEDVAFDRLLDLADTLEFRVSLAFALTPTDEFLSELADGDAN
jgi:hypothetical protein